MMLTAEDIAGRARMHKARGKLLLAALLCFALFFILLWAVFLRG